MRDDFVFWLYKQNGNSTDPKSQIQDPKPKKNNIQNPESKIQTFWLLDFGYGVAGLGPEAMAM